MSDILFLFILSLATLVSYGLVIILDKLMKS